MSVPYKIWRAVRGLQLMARCTRSFDASLLRGKRIAVVGPADSAYNTGLGTYIDGFDFVIRINKAPLLIQDGRHKQDIGSKTTILVHSFFENDFSGGGVLDMDLYKKMGIHYVVKPISTLGGYRQVFNFYKKYGRAERVYVLPPSRLRPWMKDFQSFRPTNGFCALLCALESEFAELYITGFTFFKTAYGDGYRSYQQAEEARKYMATMKIHNPDIEFKVFKDMIAHHHRKTIVLDPVLEKIVQLN